VAGYRCVLHRLSDTAKQLYKKSKEILMKKLFLRLLVLGAMLAGYEVLVLAGAGGGP
jgi:hypothetical protein